METESGTSKDKVLSDFLGACRMSGEVVDIAALARVRNRHLLVSDQFDQERKNKSDEKRKNTRESCQMRTEATFGSLALPPEAALRRSYAMSL